MSEIRDIQVIALASVEDPDGEAYYRRICRWYSEKFATPLHTVIMDLPEREILLHYYESLYYDLYHDESEEGQLRYFNLRNAILKTDAEVKEEEVDEAEADEWAQEMIEQIRREEEEMRAKKAQKTPVITPTKPADQNPNIINEDFNISVKGE